ncbi:CarD family transcriptional regulator [Bacilli bacterium PM5-9]|nr:CarD family transcriptional regulator [Bacilli bacterium PM5-9]
MYKIDDIISYGIKGVCKIVAIEQKQVNNECIDYYVLRSVFDSETTLYIPINNSNLTSRMKNIPSLDELHALIKSIPTIETIWIENTNKRTEAYKKIIDDGEEIKLIQLIKTLKVQRQKLDKDKKRLSLSDENLYKAAKKRLYDGFAVTLDIKPSEVPSFISEQLKINEAMNL